MVDLHSHVLHGLDDGARSFEQSLEMARLAASSGTTDLVCTPHANDQFAYDPELIEQRIAALASAADGLRIHRGCDLHLSYNNIRSACEDPMRYSINDSAYLLVEFSDYLNIGTAYAMLSELQRAGLIPIVTHPERNPVLSAHLNQLAAWVERGCLMQITAMSLTGGFGPRAKACCRSMIDRGLVHFVSSDGHDTVHRPPRPDQAREHLVEHYGEAYAELLLELNPRAVVDDRPIEQGPQKPARRPNKWLRFLGR